MEVSDQLEPRGQARRAVSQPDQPRRTEPPAQAPMDRPFRAIVFDWDGTAVVNRLEEATVVAALLTELLRLDVWIAVVTGTNFGHVNRQFCQLVPPPDRKRLLACTNRGSEVWGFEPSGDAVYRWVYVATPEQKAQLDAIAEAVRDTISSKTGLSVGIVFDRLNRRKIDLIPVPEWANPPKERIGDLLVAVEQRLRQGGLARGLADAIDLTRRISAEHGLPDARITSDVKHLEVGLTDKGDSMRWLCEHLFTAERIPLAEVLIGGDEFGAIGAFQGSDDRLRQEAPGAVIISVGVEPNGVPAGVLHLGGGPARFRDVLANQVKLHRAQQAPTEAPPQVVAARPRRDGGYPNEEPPGDPAWRLVAEGYRADLEPEIEGRFALGNGLIGVRASLAEPAPASRPLTLIAGLYDIVPDGEVPRLVAAPNWFHTELRIDGQSIRPSGVATAGLTRELDLARGVLTTDWRISPPGGQIIRQRELRFVSLAERSLAIQVLQLEVEGGPVAVALDACLEQPDSKLIEERREPGLVCWRTPSGCHRLAATAHAALQAGGRTVDPQQRSDLHWSWQWTARPGETSILVRTVAFTRGDYGEDPVPRALRVGGLAREAGPQPLLAAHARSWQERWTAGGVALDGDDFAARALRFAEYHLIASANPEDDRVSIGARALSGMGYLGHVFWDNEIYCLPFFTFTWPAAARALLTYRYHTLPGACDKARRMGYRGALYAWESTDTGEEATPPEVAMPNGVIIPVRCGFEEHHISADIAYAVWQYWQATGDWDFIVTAGAEILLQTARFWASRATLEADGYYHIRDVIGPDEYHESVDDNAFTNLMARWNIEAGLEIARALAERHPERWDELQVKIDLSSEEQVQWAAVAQRLWVNRDPETGIVEQFEGFSKLEYVDLAGYAGRQAPLDAMLGRDVVQRSQIVKQADVVMLLALLENAFSPAERAANFRYYAARTSHGSSLSPAMHALVAARLGDVETAAAYFGQAASIDLDQSMGSTADGIHIATQGGLWQAAVLGFAGMRLDPDGLSFDPHLPAAWKSLRFGVQWRGRQLQVEVRQEAPRCVATLVSGDPMTAYAGHEPLHLHAGETKAA